MKSEKAGRASSGYGLASSQFRPHLPCSQMVASSTLSYHAYLLRFAYGRGQLKSGFRYRSHVSTASASWLLRRGSCLQHLLLIVHLDAVFSLCYLISTQRPMCPISVRRTVCIFCRNYPQGCCHLVPDRPRSRITLLSTTCLRLVPRLVLICLLDSFACSRGRRTYEVTERYL